VNYFYLAGGMNGADIGVGWIDDRGIVHFQVGVIESLLYLSIYSY